MPPTRFSIHKVQGQRYLFTTAAVFSRLSAVAGLAADRQRITAALWARLALGEGGRHGGKEHGAYHGAWRVNLTIDPMCVRWDMFWGLLGAPGTAERIVVTWTARRSRSHGSGAEFGWHPSMLAVPQRLGRAQRAASQRPLVGTSKFEAHRISSICSCGRACADIVLTHVPSFRVRGDEMAEILRGVSMRRCRRCRRCRTLEGRPAQRLRTLDLNLLVCRAASPRRRTIHDSCSADFCSAPVGSDKCAHVRPDKMPGIAAGLSSNETAQKAGITPLVQLGLAVGVSQLTATR